MGILNFNLISFGFLLVVYLLMLLAHTLMGYWYNKKVFDENFDKAKFLDGLKTGLIVLAGMLCFIIAVTLVPQALIYMGLTELAETFGTAFSILVMGGIIYKGISKYAASALERMRGILEGNPIEEKPPDLIESEVEDDADNYDYIPEDQNLS